MKVVLIFFVLAAIFLIFSCKKCETCSYSGVNANGDVATALFTTACDKTEAETNRANCNSLILINGNGNCTCIEE